MTDGTAPIPRVLPDCVANSAGARSAWRVLSDAYDETWARGDLKMARREGCPCECHSRRPHQGEHADERRCCEPCCPRGSHRRVGSGTLIAGLLIGWLAAGAVALARWILRRWHRTSRPAKPASVGSDRPAKPASAGADRPATGAKQTIPGTIYRRPDPMIYDQVYLMAQGLAVTWNNPDIHLERPLGTPVSSHDLKPDTTYHVVARVWNLSGVAPAPDMPVRMSYLRFGIGGGKTIIGSIKVDLPVKGSPLLPARAVLPWTTPKAAGHYCLQVELLWPDAEDANPLNNVGQHNTDVKALASPATFQFPVRNDDPDARHVLVLRVDSYQIPELDACPPNEHRVHANNRAARDARTLARHGLGRFAIPDGWKVDLSHSELSLEPQEETDVSVTFTAPVGFAGRQAFNVNAMDGGRLVGGVTLYVDGH
jgi:hypothetical protein